MLELEFSPEALNDLYDIHAYSVKTWGKAQADRYLEMLEATCGMIREIPNLSQELQQVEEGLRMISSGSHFIFYRTISHRLVVIAVYHHRMDALNRLTGRLQ